MGVRGWKAEAPPSCGSGVQRRYQQVLAGAHGTCTYTETSTSCYGVAGCAVGRVGGRASLLPAKHSQHSKEPGYEVRSNLRNFTVEPDEEELYCVEYTVASAAPGCGEEELRSGGEVCVLCTSRGVQHRPQPEGGLCRGGGADGRTSSFRLFLVPACSGTWRRRRAAQACACPATATYVFV